MGTVMKPPTVWTDIVVRLWEPLVLHNFSNPQDSRAFGIETYHNAVLVKSSTGQIWLLVDGTYGRALAMWQKPVTEGTVYIFFKNREVLDVQKLPKLV